MNSPTTDELLKVLNSIDSTSDLYQFTHKTEQQKLDISFPEYISECQRQQNITSGDLIRSAQIQRTYGYQILNGTRNPGRNKVLALCLALSLPLEDVQRALTIAKEGLLYPKNQRDAIIIFCINRHLSVLETNDLLYKNQESILQ